MEVPQVVLDFAPSGRNGNGTLTARIGGEVVHVDNLNVAKSKARADFLDKLCKGRITLDRKAIGDELMKLAADLADAKTPSDPAGLPELNATAVIRPERFITPDVSGLAVPSMTTMGEKVQGRWLLYLRWADGKKEVRPMAPTLDVGDGRRLFIHPDPGEPSPTARPGWSAEARRRWLDGEAAPDPAELFRAMATRFAEFVDLPQAVAPGVTATVVCWVILTYCYQAWGAVPYLYLGGPLGSGKSRVFEVLSRLVFRPMSSSNMTGAALFRSLHSQGGCLLLDEAERLRNTRDPATGEILSMLLAGYKRGGQATRLEPVGENGFKTVNFDVFGPKALACIAGLPPALASRSIPIMMFRSPPGSEKPKRRIDADPEEWEALRDALHVLTLEHGPTWLELSDRTDVCLAGMNGRDYELWQPLLALAAWIEEHGARGLLRMMQDHAMATIDAGRDDQTPDVDETLLRLLAERRMNLETPQPKEILDAARELDQVTFRQWSAKGVANVFRRYNIASSLLHGRRVYRTDFADLLRIQATYGLSLGIEEPQAHSE